MIRGLILALTLSWVPTFTCAAAIQTSTVSSSQLLTPSTQGAEPNCCTKPDDSITSSEDSVTSSDDSGSDDSSVRDSHRYEWVARTLHDGKPEPTVNEGFAVVVLREQSDPRNEIICEVMKKRAEFYKTPRFSQIWQGEYYRLRPIYWPIERNAKEPSNETACTEINDAFDFVFFENAADQVGRRGAGPLILLFKKQVDFQNSLNNNWSIFDFDKLTTRETRENLRYLSEFINRPSEDWPRRKIVGWGVIQRLERALENLPILSIIFEKDLKMP